MLNEIDWVAEVEDLLRSAGDTGDVILGQKQEEMVRATGLQEIYDQEETNGEVGQAGCPISGCGFTPNRPEISYRSGTHSTEIAW